MQIKKIKEQPEQLTLMYLEAVLMPNGEIIFKGKTLGWFESIGEYAYKEKPKQ